MDTVALFSATQRANGGRKRHKHTGQTASIYLSDQVAKEKGKYQIGTLCHTMGIKGGAVVLDSIPDQKFKSMYPLLDFLPRHAPVFTDDGYPWLKRYNFNHRAVNHSARSKDKKRNVWARDRWSKGGVNNQVAEGFQRIVKHAFISGYSYFRPEYSRLYLDEYSAVKGLRVYGLGVVMKRAGKRGLWGMQGKNYIIFSPPLPHREHRDKYHFTLIRLAQVNRHAATALYLTITAKSLDTLKYFVIVKQLIRSFIIYLENNR